MRPYYEADGVTLYHGDCREILPEISAARLVVTDPPYVFGIASTAQEGKAGGWGDLMNSAAWYALLLREFKRITANQLGAAWVFNSWRSFPVLARAAYEAQWGIESLMVWDKEWIGPGGQRGLRPSYELAALFAQSDFAIPNRGLPDIWRSKWSSLKPNGHPAEKCAHDAAPVPAVVLDPFNGAGTTGLVATRLQRRYTGIDVNPDYVAMAERRIRGDAPLFHGLDFGVTA